MSALIDPEGRLRTAWRLAIFLPTFVALQFLMVNLAIVAVALYPLATGQSTDFLNALDVALYAQIGLVWPMTAVNVALIFGFRRWLDRRTFRSLGVTRPRASTPVGLTLGLALVGLPAVGLLLAGGYRFTGVSWSAQTAILVPSLVVAAFYEEIVCRGYLLQNFIDIGRPVAGVVLSSVIFALFHLRNPGVLSSPFALINLFGAGVAFALAYRVSGDLWFPTALHYGWNLAQGVVFQLPVSGILFDGVMDVEITHRLPAWLTGGSFGLESSVIATVIVAGLSAAFAWILARRAKAAVPTA